ncbi:AlpA family phage regulatory protein [Litoreibacter sp.]|nr:AlpA family phage regulatory protein [Litoreibacter sp.]
MKYLTMTQLRAKFGDCGRTTVYRYVDEDILPEPIKLGGRLYWIESEVDEAIQSQREAA